MTASEKEILEKEIRYHNEKYFKENSPEISDVDFDRLVQRLEKIAPESPVLQEIADSQWFNTFEKVTRSVPMLSLQKCYDDEGLENWAQGYNGSTIAMAKVDGCAIELIYDEHGVLVLAATRGDGYTGEDVTLNAKTVEGIPAQISKGPLEIRGEVYMRKSVFERFKDEFANPRNLAAGALRQKFPSECEKYTLSFLAYDVIGMRELGYGEEYEEQKFSLLEELGFQTVAHLNIAQGEQLKYAYAWMQQKREDLDYETDGVVFKYGDVAAQVEAGFTSHHPRYAIAYKFQGESGVTKIKDVKWQLSKNGRLTPVGVVEPITLSGARVTKVTLHNLKTFIDLNLREGAEVRITRSGGVIPYFEEVVTQGTGELFFWPMLCPSCGRITQASGEFLYCPAGEDCVGSNQKTLEHYIQEIGCEGFGPSVVEKLYRAGLIRTPADFHKLTVKELTTVEGIAEGLAKKLVKSLQERSSVSLETFLCALGVPSLGRQTAKLIAKKFKQLEKIYGATEEEFAEIDGVGGTTAQAIMRGLVKKYDLILQLLDVVYIHPYVEAPDSKSKVVGKSFLFTGTLNSMSRNTAEKVVETRGGEIAGSVNKDLDYLVLGDGGGAGSKWEKARKLQDKGGKVQIITEGVWIHLMNSEE